MEFVTIVLIVLAVGIGFVIFRANQKNSGAGADAADQLRKRSGGATIEDVGPGGVISLRAVGADMEDLDVTIESRHIYSQGNFEWMELEGDAGDRKIWLTVEHDDEVEVSMTLRKLRLDDLGLTQDQLTRFDDDERGTFSFEGRDYVYEESDDACFHRNGDTSSREDFYFWEFEARDKVALSLSNAGGMALLSAMCRNPFERTR